MPFDMYGDVILTRDVTEHGRVYFRCRVQAHQLQTDHAQMNAGKRPVGEP